MAGMSGDGDEGRRPLKKLVMLAVALVAAALLGPTLHRSYGGNAWLALILVWATLAYTGARAAGKVEARMALLIVLTAAALIRLPMLFQAPYLSSDMYRYVWDGRVQRAGINPYLHVPAAPDVAHLRDTAVYPNINRADYAPTIYPPSAQLFFRAVATISDSIIAMKLALLAFEALAIAAMLALLRKLSLPAASIAAYAWHPLPVWEIAGNGHIDAMLLGLTTASLAIYTHGRTLLAGAVAATAVLVKPTALLIFPVLWKRWDWKLPLLLVSICGLLYVPFLSAGWKVFGFLGGYVAEEELASGGGFRYLAMLQSISGPIPFGGRLYTVAALLIISIIAVRVGFREQRDTAAAVSSYAMLITVFLLILTPHYPWYYLALGPLLVLTRAVTPWVLMSGGFLLYDVIDGDRMLPFAWREGTLHLSALAAFSYDRLRRVQQS